MKPLCNTRLRHRRPTPWPITIQDDCSGRKEWRPVTDETVAEISKRHSSTIRRFRTTPVHAAAFDGNATSVRQLLLVHGHAPDGYDTSGRTPAVFAALAGHAEVMDLLIDFNANIAHATKCNGITPAWIAASKGDSHVLEVIVRRCNPSAFSTPRCNGQTPLEKAIQMGHGKCVQLLSAVTAGQ